MPSIETMNLTEKAVLWTIWDNYRDDYGNEIWNAPVEIDVRWENVNYASRDSSGGPVGIIAEVFTDREIPPLSLLWRGNLSDVAEATNLVQVVGIETIPDLKGKNSQRTTLCKKYSKGIPVNAGVGTGE